MKLQLPAPDVASAYPKRSRLEIAVYVRVMIGRISWGSTVVCQAVETGDVSRVQLHHRRAALLCNDVIQTRFSSNAQCSGISTCMSFMVPDI
jgi:hypothetical protein